MPLKIETVENLDKLDEIINKRLPCKTCEYAFCNSHAILINYVNCEVNDIDKCDCYKYKEHTEEELENIAENHMYFEYTQLFNYFIFAPFMKKRKIESNDEIKQALIEEIKYICDNKDGVIKEIDNEFNEIEVLLNGD